MIGEIGADYDVSVLGRHYRADFDDGILWRLADAGGAVAHIGGGAGGAVVVPAGQVVLLGYDAKLGAGHGDHASPASLSEARASIARRQAAADSDDTRRRRPTIIVFGATPRALDYKGRAADAVCRAKIFN